MVGHFFSTATPTTAISTLSLHDALPISNRRTRPRRPSASRSWAARRANRFAAPRRSSRSEEHTSELSPMYLVCRLLLEKKKVKHLITHGRRAGERTAPSTPPETCHVCIV